MHSPLKESLGTLTVWRKIGILDLISCAFLGEHVLKTCSVNSGQAGFSLVLDCGFMFGFQVKKKKFKVARQKLMTMIRQSSKYLHVSCLIENNLPKMRKHFPLMEFTGSHVLTYFHIWHLSVSTSRQGCR